MVGGIEFNTLMPQEASILKEGTELLKDTKKKTLQFEGSVNLMKRGKKKKQEK